MSNLHSQFYECDNPACRLRFPATVGHPRWNRCPACRSSIHVVASSSSTGAQKVKNHTDFQPIGHIEALLDNIRSAGNVGSILRTADGTGITKIYLCGITPSPDNSKVSKTSLGAEGTIAWEKYKNGVQLTSQLKSNGYRIWALEDLPGAQPLFTVTTDFSASPIVLVVGNELCGIDPGIIELCDQVISIPMMGSKGSYNVAVAFGIAASFLLYRQSFSQGSLNIFPKT